MAEDTAGMLAALEKANEIAAESQRLLAQQHELLKSVKWELNLSRRIQENLRVTLAAPVLDQMQAFLAERQMGMLETLDFVRANRVSLARYGDGEFRLMKRLDFNLKFQRNSPQLQEALHHTLEIAEQNPEKLIIGLPHGYRDVFWGGIYGDVWRQVLPHLEPIGQFANSHITRPHMFGVHREEAVAAWANVWRGLDVTIVTGKGSRFDLVPELFGSAKRTTFLESEPVNAFDSMGRIVDAVEGAPADLFLISLGPAGTVLAGELAMRGVWALDVGHLSSSYAYEFKGSAFPEKLSIK